MKFHRKSVLQSEPARANNSTMFIGWNALGAIEDEAQIEALIGTTIRPQAKPQP